MYIKYLKLLIKDYSRCVSKNKFSETQIMILIDNI